MGWTDFDVQCCFGGEETSRFGPRQEIGSSLYQVDTVACVVNEHKGYGSPWLVATSCTQRMALILDKNVVVFDESCGEHECSFASGFLIDAVAWSEDGLFLVYGDRGGCLSIAHLESQQVLFTKKLLPDHEARKGPCFVSVKFIKGDNGSFEVLVVMGDGLGFRFAGLDLENLKKAVAEKNMELALQIQNQIHVSDFDLTEYHEIIHSATYQDDQQSLLVAGSGVYGMSSCYLGTKDVIIEDIVQHIAPDVGFIKCLTSPDQQFILALDTMNNISIWSNGGLSYLIDMWSDKPVEDFNLFVTSSVETDQLKNSKSKEELKIVILTKPINKQRELIVLSLPNFEHVYTLTVSQCAVLATSPLQQETIMFIEGVEGDDLDDSMDSLMKTGFDVSTVRVRCLTEAIPENRFSRLLHKHKFDEAEQFACMFGIDVQLVYKVKSSYILDQLSPWGQDQYSNSEIYEGKLNELKACLDNVTDIEHVVNCCLRAQLPTLSATYDLLNYAREKINFEDRKFTKSSNLFQALLDAINRLVTFEVAFGAHQFSGQSWSVFWSTSLCDEVIRCFMEANMNSGIIIWRRHQSEFQGEFTIKKLEQILHSIPRQTPSNRFIPWLREDFVPYVLTVLPEGQCILADWLVKTANMLELSEKEHWPDNALDLAEVMYKAFSNVSQSTQGRGVATPIQFATKICKLSIPYFDNAVSNDSDEDKSTQLHINLSSAMKKLGNLVKSLREVKSLHHEYNCKLSLYQYESEDNRSIAFRLLNRIAAAELIPQTIKKYVKPYALKNNLKLDQLLYEYIVELVDLQNQVASLWEPKVIAIINEIERKEKQCDATLKLMLKACTPWSPEVEKLVSTQMKACPDNQKLIRQYQFAMLRKMMAEYSIRDINLADMSRIEDIIKYMLSTENPNALDNALEICKHLHGVTTAYVYLLQIKYWISSNKTSLMSHFLKTIPLKDARQVARYALTWVTQIIRWKPLDEEDMKEQMQVTHAVVLMLNIISRIDRRCTEREKANVRDLKNISCLQNEFGGFLSLEEYEDTIFCKQLLKEYIKKPEKFTSKCDADSERKTNKSTSSRLVRFGELLNIKDGYLDEYLMEFAQEDNDLKKVYNIACCMLKVDKEDKYVHSYSHRIQLLHKVAFLLITNNTNEGEFNNTNEGEFNWVKLADDLHAFATQAVSLCSEDNLCDYLHMSKMMRFIALIASQCESTDYQDDSKRMEGLLYQWMEDQYKDDSLVLSSADTLPLLRKMTSLSISVSSHTKARYESLRLPGKAVDKASNVNTDTAMSLNIIEFSKVSQALVHLLQENSQQELAIQILMLVLSICMQHSASLQIGIPIELEDDTQYQIETKKLEQELKASQVILTRGEAILNEFGSNLIKLILSHRIVDHDLALCYMDIFPTNVGQQILMELKNKFNNKFTRIQTLAKVGVDFGALRSNNKLKESFHALKECAFWGRKLQLLRIPQQYNIYNVHSDAAEKKRVLESLVQHKDIDRKSIINFCESFSFDEEEAILMYIECQLLHIKNKMVADITYQEKVDECVQVYNRLQNNSRLERLFNAIAIKISPYDYERLIYVFKKCAEITESEDLKTAAEENVRLLEMLSMYERTSSNVDYNFDSTIMTDELEEQQILSGKSSSQPDNVRKRLPFHLLMKESHQWQIINPELTSEQNVIKLKPIVNKLKLDSDHMFAKAVQTICEKNLKNTTKNGALSFEFSLVENILNMIEKHLIMIAAAKWLAKSLPRGAEKAKVLKAIVDRAAILVNENNGKEEAQITFKRFLDLYKRSSIENALLEHGINDEKLFMLCHQPAKLIIELYEEYGDKVKFETGKLSGAPEIHSLAETIASISQEIDLQRVHAFLMNKWLPCIRSSTGEQEEDDDELDMKMMHSVSKKDLVKKENEKNLRRVIYVLASSYNETTMQSLLQSIYETESEGESGSTNQTRIRAVQVLFTLLDTQTIESLSNTTITQIHEKLVAFIYLSELEALHISQSEDGFVKCNKEGLVKGLWRNHSQEPQGIRLIADICLDHQIYDPQLWNSLLLKLQSFDMIDYLTHVLVLLSGIPQLREIPSLTKIWRFVVTTPFQSVSIPLSPEEEKSCSTAAQLLTRCPVILDLGLPEISMLMKKAGFYIQCMMCMKLIPDKKLRETSIQAVIDDVGIEVILSKVKKTRDELGMDAHLDAIEEETFNYVNEQNMFVSLYGSAHFERLVGYLVRTRNINNLLVKTLVARKLNSALDLVSHYIRVHTSSSVAQTVNESNLDKTQALMCYLNENGLMNDVKPYMNNLLNATADQSHLTELNLTGENDFTSTMSLQYINGY